jgi:hypothetical protein
MEINFTTVILTLSLIFLISKSYSFASNYVAAVRTGYPVYISPVLSKSILWMVLGPVFQPQFKKWFPEWFYERLDISIHGWEFRQKDKMHKKLGKVFVVVSPDENVVW